MLTPEERYYKWEEFKELIEKLLAKVEDELVCTYDPYGKERDKDTPFVEHLYHKIILLHFYAERHLGKLGDQFNEWEYEKEETHLDEVLSDVLSWQFPCLYKVGGVLFV